VGITFLTGVEISLLFLTSSVPIYVVYILAGLAGIGNSPFFLSFLPVWVNPKEIDVKKQRYLGGIPHPVEYVARCGGVG